MEPGGQIAFCEGCNLIQKPNTEAWRAEIDKIYTEYSIYDTSAGDEQVVFAPDGTQRYRSATIFQLLARTASLPKQGRYLDFGCANGTALAASAKFLPTWEKAGYDISSKYEAAVTAIPGVVSLYTESVERIEGTYDLVTLLHTLEHIAEPCENLIQLRRKMNKGGVLLIQVPNHLRNPFDLVIADHANHFTVESLTMVLERAGFEIIETDIDSLPKEILIVARKRDLKQVSQPSRFELPAKLGDTINFLVKCVDIADDLVKRGLTGIFGTAIAGTWIAGKVKDQIRFFVDEDKARIGRQHLGKPIISVHELTENDLVYICMEPVSSGNIKRRLANLKAKFHSTE